MIGASTGYGLASRIAAAWGYGAKTLGVFFERPPEGDKTATAGHYNTVALHSLRPQVERAIGGKTVKVDDKGAAAIGQKLAAVKVEAKAAKKS